MVEVLESLDKRMETRVDEVIASIPAEIRAAVDALPTADVELQRAELGYRMEFGVITALVSAPASESTADSASATPPASPITPEAAAELRALLMLNPGENPPNFGTSVARYVALKAALGGDLLTKATPEQIERLRDIGCTIGCAFSTIPFIRGWDGRGMDFDWHSSEPVPPNMERSAARLNEYAALYLAMAIASDEFRARNIVHGIILDRPSLGEWIVRDYVQQCLRGAQGPLVLKSALANAEEDQETRDELLQFCFQCHVGKYLMPAIVEYLTFIMTKKIQVEQATFARRRIPEALTMTMTQACAGFKRG